MSARFLDDAAREAFKRAVESIEGATAIEVVIAVRRRSASYLHANVIVGALVAFAALAAMLFSESEFGWLAILVDPFVVGLVMGGLVELLPGVKRVLTPASRRHAHVLRAARATFVERGIHGTAGHTGLLVYISWLEQQVVLVPDTGLVRALTPDVIAKCEQVLTEQVPGGGTAVASALAKLVGRLVVPRLGDDRNELPDHIDSDLARADRRRR